MTQIDWSKAPAGTTGAMVANFDSRKTGGVTFVGKVEFIPFSGNRDCYSEGSDSWTYHEKPAPWNGEGLPPVGLDVEVLWSSISKSYVTGRILAHDEGRAVFRFTSGERKGEYQADKPHFSGGSQLLPNFRPIRTAEQIAAEERDSHIAALQKASGGDGLPPITYTHAAALYNAGARLQGEGSKA